MSERNAARVLTGEQSERGQEPERATATKKGAAMRSLARQRLERQT